MNWDKLVEGISGILKGVAGSSHDPDDTKLMIVAMVVVVAIFWHSRCNIL
jgi:hypothetical protein